MRIKIILSRKGVDTSIGKIASPIFDDGRMISLPIPVSTKEVNSYKNQKNTELIYEYYKFKKAFTLLELENILDNLGEYCHYDPDLRERTISDGWKASLGQCGPNATKLKNEYNKEEYRFIFLFFGRFRFVKEENGKYRYVVKKDISNFEEKYKCKDIHAIWGYLVVDDLVNNDRIKSEFSWHPHAADYYTKQDNVSNNPNIIFSGKGGVFHFNKARILTKLERNIETKDISMAIWDKNKFMLSSNGDTLPKCLNERINSATEANELFFRGQWQELVMDFNEEEAKEFLNKLNLEYDESNNIMLELVKQKMKQHSR